jgi:response regulator of citrate/malate metabolism
MTGASDFDIRTTYLAGARAVLLKPISAEDLLKLLTYFYQERESLRHSAT